MIILRARYAISPRSNNLQVTNACPQSAVDAVLPSYLQEQRHQTVESTLSHSQAMHAAVLRPAPERLALVVEQDAEEAPQQDQRGVGHDGRNEAVRLGPGRDEFREAVAPDVSGYELRSVMVL